MESRSAILPEERAAAALHARPPSDASRQVHSPSVRRTAPLAAGTLRAAMSKPAAGTAAAVNHTRLARTDAVKHRKPDRSVRGIGCLARPHCALFSIVSRGRLASPYWRWRWATRPLIKAAKIRSVGMDAC